MRHKVHEALELVNMSGNDKKMPVNLSGGMRKRVALARAIISPPQVILYDEPTAGLDPIVSDSINRLIRRLQEQLSRHFHRRDPRHDELQSGRRSRCLAERRPPAFLWHA